MPPIPVGIAGCSSDSVESGGEDSVICLSTVKPTVPVSSRASARYTFVSVTIGFFLSVNALMNCHISGASFFHPTVNVATNKHSRASVVAGEPVHVSAHRSSISAAVDTDINLLKS